MKMATDEISRTPQKPHSLILENRERMSVSGVTEVERFDEQEAIIHTTQGSLVIRGGGLHMEKLSLETGDIILLGSVDSIQYEQLQKEGGFLSKLFR